MSIFKKMHKVTAGMGRFSPAQRGRNCLTVTIFVSCAGFAHFIIMNNSFIRSVKNVNIRRGDIYYADLSPVVGSEQGGVRPVLIVQNDVGNRFSPTVIAAAITSQKDKTNLPTHIELNAINTGLMKDSVVLLEQVRTIDKHRLKEKMGTVDGRDMNKVNEAIQVSFGLNT